MVHRKLLQPLHVLTCKIQRMRTVHDDEDDENEDYDFENNDDNEIMIIKIMKLTMILLGI